MRLVRDSFEVKPVISPKQRGGKNRMVEVWRWKKKEKEHTTAGVEEKK